MLIPEPKKINALVQSIQFGKVVTMSNLRSRLAKDAGADIACPMTTGIFLKIVAFAAEENREMGKDVTPYWRVVKDGGKLNDISDGITLHADLLESEGHTITKSKNGTNNLLEEIKGSHLNKSQIDSDKLQGPSETPLHYISRYKGLAKLMDSTTTVTLLHIHQYGYQT